MVTKLMIMRDKYRVIYINQSNEFLIAYVFDTLKAILLYDDQNQQFKSNFDNYISASLSNQELAEYVNDPGINVEESFAKRVIMKIHRFYSKKQI